MKNAEYKCLQCGLEFIARPGPTQDWGAGKEETKCLRCGHDYLKWTNYLEFTRRSGV